MNKICKIFQLHKPTNDSFEFIQDKYSIREKVISIADGASTGWEPHKWAEALVQNFKEFPIFDKEEFCKTFNKLKKKISLSQLMRLVNMQCLIKHELKEVALHLLL